MDICGTTRFCTRILDSVRTIEGQAFLAPSNLLDKLAKDCEGLSGDLYALHRGMHGGVSNKAPSTGASAYEGGRGSWPRSKQR